MFIIIQATWKFYKRIGGSVSGIYKKVTVQSLRARLKKELEKRYEGYKEKIIR